MPGYPDYPTRDDEERAPDPRRIIDRIVGGEFTAMELPFAGDPSAD